MWVEGGALPLQLGPHIGSGRPAAGARPPGSAQEELRGSIGKAQALAGELKAVRQDSPPALLHQLVHVACPFAAQVEAGCLAEQLKWPTLNHAQAEGSRLPGTGQRCQLFAGFDGALPPLKLLAPQFLNSTQLQLVVSTANGTPIDSNRLARIEVRATNSPGIPPSAWPKLTNALVLTTNGLARLTNTIPTGQSRQVFITVEPP